MRRFVRDRIGAALERARPVLELYIAEHRRYPEGFPYRFVESAVSVREVRSFRITAVAKADLPLVTIEVLLKAWLADRAVRIRGG